jgi:hypothetical protein
MLDTAVAIAAIVTPFAAILAGFFAIIAITHQIRESEKNTRLKSTHENLVKLSDWLSPFNSYQKKLKILHNMEYSPGKADMMTDLAFETWKKLTELRGYRLESIPLLNIEIIKAIDSAVDSIEKIEKLFHQNTVPGHTVEEAYANLNKVLWGIDLYLCKFYQSSFNPFSLKKNYRYSKKRINELRSNLAQEWDPSSTENQQ